MRPVPTIAAAVVVAVSLTACGGTSKPAAAPPTAASPPASHATSSSSPTGSPSPQSTSSPKGAANTFDPCQLVTQSEASSMAHSSFGPGKEEGNQIRHECVYGAQTPNVLSVIVLTGASNQDAQAEWNQLMSDAQSAAGQSANLLTLTPDPGLTDRGEWVELNLSQIGVDARGLAFLKGSVGVYMIDLVRGAAAPSRAAFTTEAQTVLTRLP